MFRSLPIQGEMYEILFVAKAMASAGSSGDTGSANSKTLCLRVRRVLAAKSFFLFREIFELVS